MPAAEMARIHAAAFTMPRPWSAAEIEAALADPLGLCLSVPTGFLLGRLVAGEAEVLTLAVDPGARRQGTGVALVTGFLRVAKARGADSVFLEVAETNVAARALYERCGFVTRGRRTAYYRDGSGAAVDALIMVLES